MPDGVTKTIRTSFSAIVSLSGAKVLDEKFGHTIPKVEDIQDTIEQVLIKHNEAEVAKAFILYRAEKPLIISCEF